MTLQSFKLDDILFVLDTRESSLLDFSEQDKFLLVKNQGCLNFYENWKYPQPETIMEIGMFEGGSMVYLDKLFKPKKLVGLDIRQNPVESLENYRKDKDHIVTYYGRSQDKPGTLMAARQNFPKGIDLVLDDASHRYAETKATFEMLFPMVKAGGQYIIEDWRWAHGANLQEPGSFQYDEISMSSLILELVVLAGSSRIIESIHVQHELVCITKGKGVLPENPFDLSPYLRGRKLDHI